MSTPINGETEYEDTSAGSRPNLTRKQWFWVVLGIAAMTAIAAIYGLGAATQPVRWQDVGYTVDSPTSATVTFEVYLYSDVDATCQLQALNHQYAVVGVAEQEIARADGVEHRFTVDVTTVEEANTVMVHHCMPAE